VTEPVVTTYLEILEPEHLRPPSRPAPPALAFERVEPPDGELVRRLYREVGADWSWTDHVDKPAEWWRAHAETVETWLARLDGEVAGYVSLQPRDGGDVEIVYLGLLAAFHGRGLGGHQLAHAIRRGFELGPRVWVHTCTLDGPYALANYEARGMRIFRVEPPEG
jgi:ribosomal protein S18 acetylase RimI-like enzyme